MIRCVILDFDGTLTDVEQETHGYMDRYGAELGKVLGRDIARDWQAATQHVLENADSFGWAFDGKIIAPSHADPYILSACVARHLMDGTGELTDAKVRDAALDTLFRALYGSGKPHFRPELGRFFEGLAHASLPVYVVTNSNPDAVKQKLGTSGQPFVSHLVVRGSAKKFSLEPSAEAGGAFARVPERKQVAGLARPLYLRRGRYYDVLAEVWAAEGVRPEETVICGDIYEMDLAMPAVLGVATHLVTRPTTRAWERDAAKATGGLSDSLLGLLERL